MRGSLPSAALSEAHASLGLAHFLFDWDWPAADAFRDDPRFAQIVPRVGQRQPPAANP